MYFFFHQWVQSCLCLWIERERNRSKRGPLEENERRDKERQTERQTGRDVPDCVNIKTCQLIGLPPHADRLWSRDTRPDVWSLPHRKFGSNQGPSLSPSCRCPLPRLLRGQANPDGLAPMKTHNKIRLCSDFAATRRPTIVLLFSRRAWVIGLKILHVWD